MFPLPLGLPSCFNFRPLFTSPLFRVLRETPASLAMIPILRRFVCVVDVPFCVILIFFDVVAIFFPSPPTARSALTIFSDDAQLCFPQAEVLAFYVRKDAYSF